MAFQLVLRPHPSTLRSAALVKGRLLRERGIRKEGKVQHIPKNLMYNAGFPESSIRHFGNTSGDVVESPTWAFRDAIFAILPDAGADPEPRASSCFANFIADSL